MYYDPLVALVNLSPVEKLTEESSKKKSRWGNNSSTSANLENKVVQSKWGPEENKPYLPLPFVDIPPGLTPSQLDQFLREQRYDELTKKLNKGELEYVDPDIRPPSPPPIYDKNGSRINTREARVKNCMIEEHHRLVEYLLKHVEGFIAPPNYKPIKKIRKIEIPIDKYPEYNFMGLIIGPRGCNHKRLEAESGAQISIRGKGTLKEGKKTDHQTEIEANMPKHVHISADSEECVEKAVSLITPLLDPFHPLHDEYKKKGLEQLALVNGINLNQLESQRCSMCNSTAHMTFECPENMNLQNFKKPEIKCTLCGDHGHITLDCKLAKANNGKIDSETSPSNAATGAGSVGVNNVPVPPSTMPPPPSDKPKRKTYNQTSKFEKIKIDMEYKKMMSELNPDKDNATISTTSDIRKNGNEHTSYSSSNTNVNNKNDFPLTTNNNITLGDTNIEVPTNFQDLSTIFQNTNMSNIGITNNNNSNNKSGRGGRGGRGNKNNKNFNNGIMPPPMNSKNKNNPNLIPLGQNNNAFNEDIRNPNTSTSSYDSYSKSNRNSSIKNSNNKNYNTLPTNYQGSNNMPINPPLPVLPNFFNFPFMNNGMVQGGSMPYPNGQQLPMDSLYMHGFPGWSQMPMNYSDDVLAHAAAPDTNPPPLPSEGVNNQDGANIT
ncbi:hypothetical protein, conserved [Plasmodium gonderi]|uniref:Branchpoint-bridging protein n=1 Tax=Plasmodium gonderi TaxID=77519 RepID=A0A1Y1JP22_PLAGO|nr:hypothetical protein, conserved [Plasmodium gonderi]GAW81794.1 hypothetical protein, conserved [Plasmodium gonderi]